MKRITIFRRISQAVFFGITGTWLTVGTLRCPYGIPFVSCQSCPSTDCPGRYLQLPFIGLTGLSALLMGRAFCGWACPAGLVMDALGKVARWRARISEPLEAFDRYLKPLKWLSLGAAIYLIFALNITEARPFPYVVRTSSAFNFEAVRIAQSLGDPAHAVRMWIVLGAVAAGLFVSRAWCRYLCPLGALLGLFNKFSVFGILREREDLPRCNVLPGDCIMHTKPDTTDCVACGECIEACPRGILGLRARYSRTAPDEDTPEAPTGLDRGA